MLELKIDIVPFGDETGRRTLETIRIINDGTNKRRHTFGNYVIEQTVSETWPENLGEIIVKNHNRSNGYWFLVKHVAEILLNAHNNSLQSTGQNDAPGE